MPREVLKHRDISLTQKEDGTYWLHQAGHYSYHLNPASRTGIVIRLFDNLCTSKDRRYALANSVIYDLETRLEKIEETCLYKFFHFLGLM